MRRMSFLTSKNLDMTEGNLYKKLWIFTIPLIFAGLLQLLYNACDLVVCGRFGSEHSVGAIGATNSIINLILNFFIGLSIGTNVLMSRAYGSKDDERGKRIAYTSMILSVVLGIIVTIIGVIISPYFLEWMGTPDELGFAIATVADERNGYLAGVDVLVDGGSTNGKSFRK